jgi:beta-glucanase (GH16 family)
MKCLGFAWLIAVGAGCSFPSYLIKAEDDSEGGMGGSGGREVTAGAGATAGTSAGATTGGSPGGGSGGNPSAGVAGMAGSGATGGTPMELAPIGVPGKWQLTLEDEFEGVALDQSKWITYMLIGDSAFREWGARDEWIADENVQLEDGECVLTAENQPTNNHPYTSGGVNSAGLFEQEFGYFEARIRFPLGKGFWGVWALRSLAGFPPAIEGVNVLGGQPSRATSGYWFQGAGGAELVRYEGTTDYTNGYHVFGIDWQPTSVTFYVDGALLQVLDDPEERLRGPLYPSVNLSISAADSGDPVPDETTPWPGEVRIDWIRVYQSVE